MSAYTERHWYGEPGGRSSATVSTGCPFCERPREAWSAHQLPTHLREECEGVGE